MDAGRTDCVLWGALVVGASIVVRMQRAQGLKRWCGAARVFGLSAVEAELWARARNCAAVCEMAEHARNGFSGAREAERSLAERGHRRHPCPSIASIRRSSFNCAGERGRAHARAPVTARSTVVRWMRANITACE